MAYIYQIQNDVNGKLYIGKTEFSIEKRFKEHCKDAFRERNEKRPLYAAMKKYGIEHFHISFIEETDNPEEREKFWIEYLRTFKDGYNATTGGDGKAYIDYDLVVSLYQEVQSIKDVAKFLKISASSVSKILKVKQVHTLTGQEVSARKHSIPILQYDLNDNFIQAYSSAGEAARSLKPEVKSHGIISHITDVCKEKRKSAYGFKWKYGFQPPN